MIKAGNALIYTAIRRNAEQLHNLDLAAAAIEDAIRSATEHRVNYELLVFLHDLMKGNIQRTMITEDTLLALESELAGHREHSVKPLSVARAE